MYQRRPSAGFGNASKDGADAATPRTKPLKRPSQARAKFTVQAMFDAFVRIWRDKGWAGITTRAVALETGVSVGTLYDYFPNKHSLLSGYVRHCIEVLLEAIEQQVITPPDLPWPQRVHHLVRLTCGIDAPELPWFDTEMLMLESQIAEPKHHRRVFDELSAKWIAAFAACTDLPKPIAAITVQTLFMSAWGGRRYVLLVDSPEFDASGWAAEVERICCAAICESK